MTLKVQVFQVAILLILSSGPNSLHAQSNYAADLKSRWIEYTFTKIDRTYYSGSPHRTVLSNSDGKAVVENTNVKHLDRDSSTIIGYSSKMVDVDAESRLPFSDLKSTVTVVSGQGKMATLQDTDVNLTLGSGRKLTGFQRKIRVFDGEHIFERLIRIGPGEKDRLSSYPASLYPEWVYHPAESYDFSDSLHATKKNGHLIVRNRSVEHIFADKEVPYLLEVNDKRNAIMHTEQKYMSYHPTPLGVALPSSVTLQRRTYNNKPQFKKSFLDFTYNTSSEARFTELLNMASGQ